jgi:hypothetical protein
VTSAEDQHVVEALSSNGADPTFRERVCPGCPDGRLHDAEALGPEDLVERSGELGVPVPDEKHLLIEASGDRQVPSQLGDPGRVGSAGGAGHVHTPRGELDEKQDVQGLQPDGLDREEVAGQRSPALRSEELGPGGTGAPWGGPEARSAKDSSDRARSDPDPELAELSLDPHAPPSRILPPKTEDEIADLRTQRRPARASPPVGPLASDELAVPSKQRLRRHQERGPTVPGEGPARRREERPIGVLQVRASDRAAENLHLVAEDGVLELELGNAPPSGEHADPADEHEVDEGSQGPRMLHASVSRPNPVLDPHRPSRRRSATRQGGRAAADRRCRPPA